MNGSAAEHLAPISVEAYLAGEELAQRKHEYVDGMVYAMVGGRFAHNLIASNVLIELGTQLKSSPYRVLNSDSKLKVETKTRTRFDYPDVSVVCGDNVQDDVFQDKPTVVVEVLSQSTRRTDEGEKLELYQTIPTLSAYLLVEHTQAAVTAYHRDGTTFRRQVYVGMDSVIELPAINARLLLADVFANVTFTPEPELP